MTAAADISYAEFLAAKAQLAPATGFEVDPDEIHPALKPHQRDATGWGVRGGRRAWFASFGLGKSLIQLEALRLITGKLGAARGLIVCPLGVRQEFARDAHLIGVETQFIRTAAEASHDGIYLTNYESVRDGRLDPRGFDVVSLDEAAILRGRGATKTFRELMRMYEGSAAYRFVATATPSPNEYQELLAYAAFLDIMDVGQARTRFFKRDSTKADHLTLHPHMEAEFWAWIASWALFLNKPSDLGHDDSGYELPPLEVRWHEVPSADAGGTAGVHKDGQAYMFRDASFGVQEAAAEKRTSLAARVAKTAEIVAADPDDHFLLWHDLEDERHAIAAAVPGAVAVWGSEDLDEREQRIADFSDGKIQILSTKPVLAGAGCNFQRHCHRAVFTGIGFRFHEFVQAIHRIQRFLQAEPVQIDIIYSEAERGIRAQLERKWQQHDELVARMSQIIRDRGLARDAMAGGLTRSLGVERKEMRGGNYLLVNADAVEETAAMDTDSVDLIVTSIPFCYDDQTEVLTRRGWIGFGQLKVNDDEVATVSLSGQLEYQRPSRVVWEPYEGEMIHFAGRSFNLLVTPNHRMYLARRGAAFGPGKFEIVPAGQVAAEYENAKRTVEGSGRILRGWRTCLVPPRRGDGERPERITIPPLPDHIRTGHGVQLYWIEAEDFMRLAGWYLSEGHADSFETTRSGGRLSIAQLPSVNAENYGEIAELMVRIGLPPSLGARQVSVWCRNLAYFMQAEFGHRAENKRIPRWVLDLHPDLLNIMRDTMMKGDGAKNGSCYTSISPELREAFQEVCLKTGWRATLNGTKVVNTGSTQLFPEIRHVPERIQYSGMIGCATVPNGTLIVRRNGQPCVSGNSTQYEYSPSFNDFGHSEDNAHFWAQMDYLTSELFRVLAPGRVAAVHVKDRIAPGGLTGLGFQTIQYFHAEAITHYLKHGFAPLGMIPIVTDVVRENNQTYRLGWTEQCKDGSKMGVGCPEYVLLWRKPPTDSSDGYADTPVVKSKDAYSRARWQTDAHGFWRSSGNRPLLPEELDGLPAQQIFRRFRDHYLASVYDYDEHVRIGEHLDRKGRLPSGFMLLQPPSWRPDVWTDVARMRTLNMQQERKGQQFHVCPLPMDIASRLIDRYSMPGETVFDPFMGIGTVPLMAVKAGRRGQGVELNTRYFADACAYVRTAADEASVPALFDLASEADADLEVS